MNQYLSEGFFKSLFDFSFTHFILTKLIKILYGLEIVIGVILAMWVFIECVGSGFKESFGAGVLGLIGGLIAAPVVFLIYLICARIWLESVIVMFRISEYVAEIALRGRRGNSSGSNLSAPINSTPPVTPVRTIPPQEEILSYFEPGSKV